MSGYDDMARHVRDALEESEVQSDGSCIIRPEHYLQLNADFEAWDEADDAKRVSEERRDEVERLREAMREVLPYLEQGYMEDGEDDEPIGWCADPDGTNQRPLPLTFGMIRRFRAALTPVPGER